MHIIRIIRFFSENRLCWQFEVEKFLQTYILGYLFIYAQIRRYWNEDRKFLPLRMTLRISYLILEHLRLLLFTVRTCV